MLNEAEILRLIPHGEAMRLIDRIDSVDDRSIVCSTMSHCRPDHPLLTDDGRLHAVVGGEYGAQAAALHGTIRKGEPLAAGVIALFRNLVWHHSWLNEIDEALRIEATMLTGGAGIAYHFAVSADTEMIVSGEVGIILR